MSTVARHLIVLELELVTDMERASFVLSAVTEQVNNDKS
jgi:hypothetical protein